MTTSTKTAGSAQLREFRIARRDGATIEEAAELVGFSMMEAKLTAKDDDRDPPGEHCYVRLGVPAVVETPSVDHVVLVGDCRETMRAMPDASVDAIVCDPPYELGFMGKKWDSTGIAYCPEVWSEALRVLKPGGHLLAFSGSRTYHRMVVAIEDAGFEIRDQLMWIYGSGFPKSLDVSKAIDKAAGAERKVVGTRITGAISDNGKGSFEAYGSGRTVIDVTTPATPEAAAWSGWGTALKPAHEPIVMARKPLCGTVAANVLAHGVGGINVDGCRIPSGKDHADKCASVIGLASNGNGYCYGEWNGERTDSFNDAGRFPANVLHDGSDEVVALFPNSGSGDKRGRGNGSRPGGFFDTGSQNGDDRPCGVLYDDSGSAARFFYSAKASRADRSAGGSVDNIHPTVKPTDVMRWLVRLVTPKGGIVLDPFTGSGSTGRAAALEGMRFVGCELSEEYATIARARIADAVAQASTARPGSVMKAVRAKAPDPAQGSLF